jgi:hypothetical protein
MKALKVALDDRGKAGGTQRIMRRKVINSKLILSRYETSTLLQENSYRRAEKTI